MRTERIINGIKVIEVTPDLTKEEREERAAWIMEGLEKVYQSHKAKENQRKAEASEGRTA